MTKVKMTVGIPTYCGATDGEDDLLGLCLRALRIRTASVHPFDVVVVDDSGDDGHRAKSRALCERFNAQWLCHPENRGVAAGWNTLTRAAKTPLVTILNDDFFVARGWLDALLYALEENQDAGSFGLFAFFCRESDAPWLLDDVNATVTPIDLRSGMPSPEETAKHTGKEQPGRCMSPPGCGFGFRREVYDLIGGFDESIGKAFYEETDFGVALAAHGLPSYTLQWPMCHTIMSATFRRSPVWTHGVPDLFIGPRTRFVEKWAQRIPEVAGELRADLAGGGGGTYPIHKHLMGSISFRRVRWLDPNGPRDELVTGEEGYHA